MVLNFYVHYTASHYLLSSRTKAFDFGTKFTSFMVLPHSIGFFIGEMRLSIMILLPFVCLICLFTR